MPKIEQLDWSKLTPKAKDTPKNDKPTSDKIYWRNKKPIQFKPTNIKPFFTCSKCGYEGKGRADFKNHWSLEH